MVTFSKELAVGPIKKGCFRARPQLIKVVQLEGPFQRVHSKDFRQRAIKKRVRVK